MINLHHPIRLLGDFADNKAVLDYGIDPYLVSPGTKNE